MIAAPQIVLELWLACMAPCRLTCRFGGGHEESDGIVYAYPCAGRRLLLKIMAIPTQGRRAGIFCLDERLRFVRFLGENGARIVFPSVRRRETYMRLSSFEAHTWVGYGMEIAPGKSMPETTWDPEIFRNWGQAIGGLHRLAGNIPHVKRPSNPRVVKDSSLGSKNGSASIAGVRMKM